MYRRNNISEPWYTGLVLQSENVSSWTHDEKKMHTDAVWMKCGMRDF